MFDCAYSYVWLCCTVYKEIDRDMVIKRINFM